MMTFWLQSVKMGFITAAVPCSVGIVKLEHHVIKLMDLVQMAVLIYTSLLFAQVILLFFSNSNLIITMPYSIEHASTFFFLIIEIALN